MTQGRWTVLGVLLLTALLLVGCGGGGGDDGVKQDLEAQLEMLMAERDAAQTAQATAEAARAAAEEARATADTARMAADEARATAETERDAALTAQMEAEAAEAEAIAAQAEAVAAQAEAVAAQAEAEAGQMTAETARDAAVEAKTAAETARDEARDGETQAKVALIAAQSAQAQAERERDRAEAAKMQAEAAEAVAETERDAANTAKNAAETARDDALVAKMQVEEALTAARTKAMQDLDAANTKAADDLAALQSRLDDANEDLQDAKDDLEEALDDLDDANAELAMAKQERNEAERALATARGTLEGLRAQLIQAQQDALDAEQRRREAEAEAARQIEQAEQQANVNVRAPALRTVLGSLTASDETSATVSRMRGGTLQFMPVGSYTSGSAAPSVPGSWSNRASFTRQSGTSMALANDTVYLYSNIQAPGSRAFWKVHGESVTMNADLGGIARGSSAQPTTADTEPSTPGRQYEALTVNGSLSGASGRFTCTTGCTGTISTDSATGIDAHVTFSQGVPDFTAIGSWTFTPGSINASYQVDQDDAYLYFGIWVSEPDSVSGTPDPDSVSGTPDFEYIAGGGGVTVSGTGVVTATTATPTNLSGLTGTATFSGGAIGKYAMQGQVGQQNARTGTFTATATFTADFGDDTALGTLAGSITDFREGGSSLADWRVTLGSTANVGLPSTISADTTGSTVGSIGGVPVGGNWGADFYGSDNVSLADRTMYPVTRYPVADLAGVTGWFNATSPTAALAGAFGAACSTGSMCAR